MPAHQDPRREEQGDEWLRKELKSLRRIPAPWYFEANLRRRLYQFRGRKKGAAWIARPLPAYGVSAIGVVGLAFVGYLLFLHPGTQEIPVAGSSVSPAPALPSAPAPRLERPAQRDENAPASRRKVEASHPETVAPSAGTRAGGALKRVAPPQEERRENVVREELTLPKVDSVSPRAVTPEGGFVPAAAQKSVSRSAVFDSARAMDSLKNQPRKLKGVDSAAVSPRDSAR